MALLAAEERIGTATSDNGHGQARREGRLLASRARRPCGGLVYAGQFQRGAGDGDGSPWRRRSEPSPTFATSFFPGRVPRGRETCASARNDQASRSRATRSPPRAQTPPKKTEEARGIPCPSGILRAFVSPDPREETSPGLSPGERRALPNPPPARCPLAEPCLPQLSRRPARRQRQTPCKPLGCRSPPASLVSSPSHSRPLGESRQPPRGGPLPQRERSSLPSAGKLRRPRERPPMGTLPRPPLPSHAWP